MKIHFRDDYTLFGIDQEYCIDLLYLASEMQV